MRYKSIIAIIIIPALAYCARAGAFDYSFIINQLKMGAPDHVEFQQVADTPVTYRAWGVWNFGHPAATIAGIATDFGNYSKIFRHVYRCDRITEPARRVSGLGTWYVEGRAAIARVWAIGNIDTLGWKDPSLLRFIAHQNEDQTLESKWNHSINGFINYRTHGVYLAAFILAIGSDSCRVGIVAQGWVRDPMPHWLISMATGLILPQLLGDLEKEAQRRHPAQKPQKAPWYKRWYKNIKDFLFSTADQRNIDG
ncbi:MAG TPA: hypothetical protein VLX68_01670 [Chitinivibrionales bacterium]|nr:hypothetical protein [Chitinivibrionales bacterium]